jgi:hypothetical protein
MEETRTTIHTGLVRRNNFLRENPMGWRFVAARPEPTPDWPLSPRRSKGHAMTEQEPERSVSACKLHW